MNSRGAFIARACRGPILLITIGFLFAVQQAGVVSFERTWPLLIIVLGLLKLLERVFAPPPNPAGPFVPPYQAPGQPYSPGQQYRQGQPPPPPPGGFR